MRSKLIIQSMLENGFLSSESHNPNDYVNYVVRAIKILDTGLQPYKQHEEIAEIVAAMFDSGFCTRDNQKDPSEWIMFAETAIAELGGIK